MNKDNEVEYRQVKVGRLQDGMTVIESGIGPDDLVIVNGLQRAAAGSDGARRSIVDKKDVAGSPSVCAAGQDRSRQPGKAATN